MHQLSSPEAYFAALMRADPSKPLVTYYDEASGERSELSVKSLANWVAKTHHLLGTELGLGVGDTAFVSLPAHWISVPVLLGCWSAGLEVTSSPGPAAVGFVSPAGGGIDAPDVGELFVVSPIATGSPGDYIAAVRPQADAWGSVQSPAGPDDACLDGRTRAEVVADALERVPVLGLSEGARVLTTRTWAKGADWVDTLVAPLAVGGSIVQVAHCADPAVLERRMQQERATVRLD